jgi:hypothetical protein
MRCCRDNHQIVDLAGELGKETGVDEAGELGKGTGKCVSIEVL